MEVNCCVNFKGSDFFCMKLTTELLYQHENFIYVYISICCAVKTLSTVFSAQFFSYKVPNNKISLLNNSNYHFKLYIMQTFP